MLNLEPEIRHTCLGFQIYSVQGSHLHKSKGTGLETHVQAVEDWIGLDEPRYSLNGKNLCLLSLAFIMDWRVLDSFSILYKENFL